MRVTAKAPAALTEVLEELVALGCRVATRRGRTRDRRRPRRLRARRLLLHHEPPDARSGIGGQWVDVEKQRMDAVIVIEGGARDLPQAARRSEAATPSSAASRDQDRPGVPGARPPRLRVHDQRDLVRAPRRGRRVAHRGDDARRQGRPATGSRSSPARSSCTPAASTYFLRADSRRLRGRAARGQRARRARRRAGALRHVARRRHGERAARSRAATVITCARSTRSTAPAGLRAAVDSGVAEVRRDVRVHPHGTSTTSSPAASATTVRCPTRS